MKLYNVKDIKGLFETVNDCEGRVEMVLPSKNIELTNAVEMEEIMESLAQENGIKEIELIAEKRADVFRLLKFAYAGAAA